MKNLLPNSDDEHAICVAETRGLISTQPDADIAEALGKETFEAT